MTVRDERLQLAEKRLCNILRSYIVASARTLEQKISDAGPNNQRINPHILTTARKNLIERGIIKTLQLGGIPWFYLAETNAAEVEPRAVELDAIHRETQRPLFVMQLGQALEIATFRALRAQTTLNFFGHFSDLDEHDDSTLYSKEEPPSSLSGRRIPSGRKLDFLIHHENSGYAGVEIKNVREWFYPNRVEIREMLAKCCALNVVPVLIARRIHFSTFSILNRCGVIIHETFNQLYPDSAKDLADKVKDKNLLGYHDVRVGNTPDSRLMRFIEINLPTVLPTARQNFEAFKDLLSEYGNEQMSYKSFAARVKLRSRGEAEDLAEGDEVLEDGELSSEYE
jgi:hypothetical protein